MLKDYEIRGQDYRLKDRLDCIPAVKISYVRTSGQDIPVRNSRAGDVLLVHTNGRRQVNTKETSGARLGRPLTQGSF